MVIVDQREDCRQVGILHIDGVSHMQRFECEALANDCRLSIHELCANDEDEVDGVHADERHCCARAGLHDCHCSIVLWCNGMPALSNCLSRLVQMDSNVLRIDMLRKNV